MLYNLLYFDIKTLNPEELFFFFSFSFFFSLYHRLFPPFFLYEFQARAGNVSIMKLIKVNWVFSSRVNPGCLVRLKGSNKTLQSVLRVFNYSQNAFIKTGAAAARDTENVLPFAWNSRKRRHYFVFSFFFPHPSPNPSVPQGSHRPRLLETREGTLLYACVSCGALVDFLRCSAGAVFNLSPFF